METNVTNAYDVLNVPQTASNAEITKSFALAMKHRKHSPDAIAKARKSLMNPEERIIADYLRPVLPTIHRFKSQDFIALYEPVPSIDWLAEFDRLEQTIADTNEVSEIDRQLGITLF
jgi:hypothetical protein